MSGWERKSIGNGLNAGFSSSSPWNSNNIWGNSRCNGAASKPPVSRDITRDNSASREGAQQTHTSDSDGDEEKMGSRTLLASSVSDDRNCKAPWGLNRSQPTGRSISQTQYNEPSGFQHRSVSSVGVSTPLPAAAPLSYAARPHTINLNGTTSTQSRATVPGPYGGGRQDRIAEQPPNVYTKFNRASDPNTEKQPDSAKEGLFGEYSPTDTRKAALSPYANASLSKPPSRDGQNKPPFPYGHDTPVFKAPNYSQSNHISTQNSSRAPSISSSRMSTVYNTHEQLNSTQLALKLDRINLNGENRFPQSTHPPNPSAASWVAPSVVFTNGANTKARWDSSVEVDEDSDEPDEYDGQYAHMHGRGGSLTLPRARPGSNFDGNYSQSRPHSQRFMAADFRSSQQYNLAASPAGTFAALRSYSVPGPPLELQRPSNQVVHMQDTRLLFDPNSPQIIAHPGFNAYGQLLDSYLIPSPVAMGSTIYGQPLPMPMHVSSNASGQGETTGREGMISAVLNDFKTNPKSRRYELKDIYGHIPEFSGDQHGSRFIQTKLETANSDEKDHVFSEILQNAITLMQDVFGNYVTQKFFEHGDQMQKKILANKMKKHVLALTLSMYGCRVVQKALDHVLVDQQIELLSELRGHVLDCVQSSNGNHVIQKAIERCDPSTTQFILESFEGHVQQLSVHSYGCRVIQRCLERENDLPGNAIIMRELLHSIQNMIGDQYGNYVVQHVVQHGTEEGRRHVMDIVGGNLEMYSKHKFASNVVEKCLRFSDDQWRRKVVDVIAHANPRRGEGDGVFVGMIKDQYGNYVIRESCPN